MNVMSGIRGIFVWGLGAAILASCLASAWTGALPAKDATVEELKARLTSASLGDRPRLCIEIAEKQLEAADKLYAATESEKAQAILEEVASYAEMARDYSIQSRKREKQTEIIVRRMAHKLNDIKHAVIREDQPAVQSTIQRLQHVSDDLLGAMFPKGNQ